MVNQNKNVEIMFQTFINNLVAEKGLGNLDPDVLKQIKLDLFSRLEDRINVMFVAKLPPEKLEEFEKLLDKGNSDQLQEYLQKNIPDLDEQIALELLSFRQTYLNL